MGIYLLVGLIIACLFYRKDLLGFIVTVVTWPFVLAKSIKMAKEKEEQKEEGS